MSKNNSIETALKYYIILKECNKEPESIQKIEPCEKESWEYKFNKALEEVQKENAIEQLKERIELYKKTAEEIKIEIQKEELDNNLQFIHKQDKLVQQCYKSFVTVCIFNEQYRQTIKNIVNEQGRQIQMNDFKIKKDDITKHIENVLNESIGHIEEEKDKEKHNELLQSFIECIKRYYQSFEVQVIKNKPIQIKISFREFFNGFRKRVNISQNGKKMIYLITRNPCQNENKIFEINGQRFEIIVDETKWKFIEQRGDTTVMEYYFDQSQITSKSITLPSGKVILLNNIREGNVLSNIGYGKNGGKGEITFREKKGSQ